MRWRALPVILLAFTLRPASADAAGPPAPRRPLLWTVERHGRVSHLFGTVHLPLDPDAALGPHGRAALDGAKRVFLELDSAQGLTFLLEAVARAELPEKESLRALLDAPTWKRLTTTTKGHIPPERLDRLQPWFVALTAVHLAAPARSIPALRRDRIYLDGEIDQRARARKIPIEALESTLDHLQVMSRMPRNEAIAMIEEALANSEASRDELAGLVNAYVTTDDRPLLKTFGRLVRRKPALAERLLFRRNEAWIQRLMLWLGDGQMFIAAGTFHMFGDRGLVELLRRRGFKVERVRAEEGKARGAYPSR